MATLDETPRDRTAEGERIAKVIARSGLCSRRDAEVLIGEKRVSVNGAVIESAALDVFPSDKVLVDGKPLAAREPPRLWRYHKPKGRVTTHKDPEGRPTVFEALPEGLPRLISVGRLDFNTEGLLLLTNDGDLARHLELPSTGWARRYRVRAFGQIEQSKLDELAGGLKTGGVNYGPIEASLEREQGDNVWITLSIREGKNREVRRIMDHLGLTVNRLIRVSFGPFMLGDLEPGQIEEVKTSVLKDQLGPRLSRQLGVKREPLREERRLPPARPKPGYLRRKPAAPDKPERQIEERPMRRRRVLQMDGSEAPRVELVPEKKRRPRFGEERGAAESYRRSRDDRPDREDRKRPSSRDVGKRWNDRDRAGEPYREGERGRSNAAHASNDRPRRDERERPASGGRGAFAPARTTERKTGERPRWKSRPEESEERPRPQFRKEGGDRAPRQDRDAEGTRELRQERPPFRRRDDSHRGADKPKSFEKRFQRDKDGQETRRRPRTGSAPPRERAAEGDAAGGQERRSFKRPRKDDARSAAGKPRTFSKGGFKGPRRKASAGGGGAKPFKRRDGQSPRPRPSVQRKPRPETEGETP